MAVSLVGNAVWVAGSSAYQLTQLDSALDGALRYSVIPTTSELVRIQANVGAAGSAICNVSLGSLLLSTDFGLNNISLRSGATVLATNSAPTFSRDTWHELALRVKPDGVTVLMNSIPVLGPVAAGVSGSSHNISAVGSSNVLVRNVAIEPIMYVPQNLVCTKGIKADTFFGNLAWASVTSKPAASTTQAGVVQLTDSTASTSITTAATANAVNAAFVTLNAAKFSRGGDSLTGQVTILAPTAGNALFVQGNIAATSNIFGVQWSDVLNKPDISSTDGIPEGTANLYYSNARVRSTFTFVGLNYNQATGQVSTVRANINGTVGVCPLSDSVTDASIDAAATANACKTAYDAATSRVLKSGDTMTGLLTIQGAGLANALVVQGNISATSNIYGVQWSDIANKPSATTTTPGIVQLDDTITSNSTTTAATANAVRTLAISSVAKAGDTMTGQLTITQQTLQGNALYVQGNISATSNIFGVQWVDIAGTPTTFVPAAHTHAAADITDFAAAARAAISTGTGLTYADGVFSANAASTTVPGIVTLADTTSSTSTTAAATANAVKAAFDAAATRVLKAGDTMTGALDITAGNLGLSVRNTGNTDRSQQASMIVQTGGSLAGNSFLALDQAAVGGWSIGLDAADSNKFKIQSSNTFTSNTRLTIDNFGNVGLGSCVAPTCALDVSTGSVRFGPYLANASGLFVASSNFQLFTPTDFAFTSNTQTVESSAYPLAAGAW
jgi:hypothetical protein